MTERRTRADVLLTELDEGANQIRIAKADAEVGEATSGRGDGRDVSLGYG